MEEHRMISLLERYAQNQIPLCVSGYIYASKPISDEEYNFIARREIYLPTSVRWGHLDAYEVVGRSMERPDGSGIRHGEVVIVRIGDIESRYGTVYALSHETAGLILKRLDLRHGRRVLLSDNPDVKPITRLNEFSRLGKIVGVVSLEGAFRFANAVTQGHFSDFGER